MRIFITGGTGLIGRALVHYWLAQGHQISLLTRSPQRSATLFPPSNQLQFLAQLPTSLEVDAIVNLAGEPIFERRWSTKQKQQLWQSRIEITEKLTALIRQSATPPSCFISGSASGYYGDCGAQLIDEQQPAAQHFSAQLCQAWEQAAQAAQSEQTRVCVLRTGLVLAPQGGLLAKLLPIYGCGLGGKLGNGQQFMPWIALTDMVRAIDFLLQNPASQGAFNLSAPQPVRNADFNQLLAKQLQRPAFASLPSFALKLLFGERAQLLLDSQNMYPQKLLAQGFQFEYPQLAPFLAATFGKPANSV